MPPSTGRDGRTRHIRDDRLNGLPASGAGLFFGIRSLQSPGRGIAIAGVALSALGLLCAIGALALGLLTVMSRGLVR